MNWISNLFTKSNCDSQTINICMVGCVSAGKSTISNTFLGEDYAECRRRRTTMMPSVFIESSDLSKIDESYYLRTLNINF